MSPRLPRHLFIDLLKMSGLLEAAMGEAAVPPTMDELMKTRNVGRPKSARVWKLPRERCAYFPPEFPF